MKPLGSALLTGSDLVVPLPAACIASVPRPPGLVVRAAQRESREILGMLEAAPLQQARAAYREESIVQIGAE